MLRFTLCTDVHTHTHIHTYNLRCKLPWMEATDFHLKVAPLVLQIIPNVQRLLGAGYYIQDILDVMLECVRRNNYNIGQPLSLYQPLL